METRKLFPIGKRTTLLLTACVVACASGEAANILDLGFLSGDAMAYGQSVSESGRVTGLSRPHTGNDHAYRTRAGQALNESTDALDNVHQTLTGLFSSVTASSGADIDHVDGSAVQLVGTLVQGGAQRAFWYHENSGTVSANILPIPAYYGTASGALALQHNPSNGSAVVAGYMIVSGQTRATRWYVSTSGASYTDLSSFLYPGVNSYLTDTDGSRAVGYTVDSFGYYSYAFINDGSSVYQLSIPSWGTAGAALGMATSNTTTRVVGYYVYSGAWKPMRWTYTGSGSSSYTELYLPTGYTNGAVRAINDAGVMVGSVWGGFNPEAACVWYPSGSFVLLQNLSYTGSSFMALNRANKITSSASGSKVAVTGHFSSPPKAYLITNWY